MSYHEDAVRHVREYAEDKAMLARALTGSSADVCNAWVAQLRYVAHMAERAKRMEEALRRMLPGYEQYLQWAEERGTFGMAEARMVIEEALASLPKEKQ